MFYKKIMLAIDGSDTSISATEEVIKLIKNQEVQLKVIHVVDGSLVYYGGPRFDYASYFALLKKEGQDILNKATQLIENQVPIKVETTLLELRQLQGRVSEVIVEATKEWPADLLVLGTHGRKGFSRFFLGSVAEHVMRIATTPVLLIRASS
ncbi:universal stress protein [Legionella bozemanae]|uniref:Universal stress protein n=1 Tax=Legionella bozemanae TaxID=447 RepID=A0A0W0RQ89_LEGBO|nr:universal stress protein [Legionella bozemanae]KTC73207.1 universal stress protein [Legionella bozemanae]STO34569.1 Putative universal stress protein SAV1710 [Legionella bozemanae]